MSNATASVVQNGIVRNMTSFGIRSQATGLRVQDITAIHNGADGINGTSRTFVVNSVSIENGQDGIVVNLGSVVDGAIASGNGRHGILDRNKSVLTRSSAQGNAGRGFYALSESKFGKNNLSASNGEADLCGFGDCTERRRIFLTKTSHKGDTVLTACRSGFHVASQAELYDIGQYHYDNILGITSPEGVTGAPLGKLGWVRVGGTPVSLENCFGWTRALDLDHVGGVVHLQVAPQGGAPLSDLIVSSFRSCAFDHPVWCIEDN
jgi:hypothetical protein